MSTAALTPDSFMGAQRPALTPDSFMQANQERPDFAQNPPGAAKPPNPILQAIRDQSRAQFAGLPGGSMDVPAASETAKNVALGGIGLGAAAVGGPAVLPLAKRAFPYVAPFVASEGINYARQNLPLGKYIPPGAELAPFLLGGKGKAAEAEEPVYPGAPRPETPPPEVLNPALASEARTLPGQVGREVIGRPTVQSAAPIPPRQGLMLPGEVETPRPSLREQIQASQTERRISQQPYSGLNRRIAPEMRGFESAPPIDPERLGIDYRPAEDLGIKVREGTEAKMGPIKRRAAKPLQQAEVLRTRPRLIEEMGGRPPEEITEPPRSNWPPEAPNVPRQTTRSRADLLEDKSIAEQVRESAESEDAQRMGQERRAWFGRNAPAETKGSLVEQVRSSLPPPQPKRELLPGDPGYKWKMRRR